MLEQEKKEPVVLIADPKIVSIPIEPINDPIINLIDQSQIAYGPSPEVENNTDYTKLRKTVYEKLVYAQERLPASYRFCLYEGYRSLQLQKQLFDARYKLVKENHPAFDSHALFEETIKLVSPVTNWDGTLNIPPHSTGGAIDVYLIDKENNPVDMGMHPKDWLLDTEGLLSATHSTSISKEAHNHRSIMSEALTAAGFANYPTEYWHWSYGDKYWAYMKNKSCAIYNSI